MVQFNLIYCKCAQSLGCGLLPASGRYWFWHRADQPCGQWWLRAEGREDRGIGLLAVFINGNHHHGLRVHDKASGEFRRVVAGVLEPPRRAAIAHGGAD